MPDVPKLIVRNPSQVCITVSDKRYKISYLVRHDILHVLLIPHPVLTQDNLIE
jgi:hypothetical protein